MDTQTPVTDLLDALGQGDHDALGHLVSAVYQELRTISGRLMAKERAVHTLQPTALINEVYLRMLRLKRIRCDDRAVFLRFAARIMRQVLIEHARARRTAKRGGGRECVEIDIATIHDSGLRPVVDLLDLDRALTTLEEMDPKMVKLIELQYFAGLSQREAAEAAGYSRSTAQREWAFARRWLARELGEEDD